MHLRLGFDLLIAATALAGACGCQRGPAASPPPDVRRPVLRSDAELAAQREQLIESGKVVPTSAPVFESERPAPVRPPPTALRPKAGSIAGDILVVNNSVLTVGEVLFVLSDEIKEARESLTEARLAERVQRWAREVAQQEIGSLLVYEKAMGNLDDPKKEALDKAVDQELQKVVNHDFGGSSARLANYLTGFGLDLDKFRERLRRQLVVSSYTREIIAPKIQLRRDELLARYRDNEQQYTSPETRELQMIEAPFERFLPEGVEWDYANPDQRARARLAAVRHIRAAAEAVKQRPFEEAAREFSKSVHAESGGSWGDIGAPLNPPYDEISAKIFAFQPGQVSEPIETVNGWYIVRCGKITPKAVQSFLDVQDELREAAFRERFNKLAAEYMVKLARNATISSLDDFVAAAVKRALETPVSKSSE
jgi:hypothetical protein